LEATKELLNSKRWPIILKGVLAAQDAFSAKPRIVQRDELTKLTPRQLVFTSSPDVVQSLLSGVELHAPLSAPGSGREHGLPSSGCHLMKRKSKSLSLFVVTVLAVYTVSQSLGGRGGTKSSFHPELLQEWKYIFL
jgi:hypothetical protein